jgi:hypothetical protein
MDDLSEVYCVVNGNKTDWFWVPIESEIINPDKVKSVGPFSSRDEALEDAMAHCWVPGAPGVSIQKN